jgi:trimethylamine--corrinoid protein Co-methyltransferase
MKTSLQVLSSEEQAEIHERSLSLLAQTGVRMLSERGREILSAGGAEVDKNTCIVRFPRQLIEDCLRLCPSRFRLGGRRPDWGLDMNSGGCTLLADGGATSVLDRETGALRPGNFNDWLTATILIDAIDEIGVYWNMVEAGLADTPAKFVAYWRNLFSTCSKHIQDSTDSIQQSRLLLDILQIVFGSRETIRKVRPFSFLLCPMSPLVIDRRYVDAYLETIGFSLPAAIMPMPLMGASGPASIVSNLVLANSEVLAMLCLVQAAAPGTPLLYAPIPQSIEPHTWRYTGGAVENALFGAAVTEMGRFYGLPVEASTGGTDQYTPNTQAGYERTLNWSLPCLARPDILVGPGLLGGSTILCLEQMMIDVEIFRRCQRLSRGIPTSTEQWLEETIAAAGPGGNFLNQRSTAKAARDGAWYVSRLGFHDTYEKWKSAGRPDVFATIHDEMSGILSNHHSIQLDEDVNRELTRLEGRLKSLPG